MTGVAFDLREPARSGIARVGVSIAKAFLERFGDEFEVTLAGPVKTLREMGVCGPGRTCRFLDWDTGRYSFGTRQWLRAQELAGQAVWYFPNWDVPWLGTPDRFVFAMHDLAHLLLPEHRGIKRFVARQWIRRSLLRARRVCVGSRYSAQEITAIWPNVADKLVVVPHGVDDAFFGVAGPLPREVSDRLQADPFMLSVGIRKERKNLRMGVEVLSRTPGLRWVVVGDSYPEWEKVESLAAAAGVADRMIVLERQSDAILKALYQAAAFLLFPSRYEGFGLPIIEALAGGTPVIASRTTSTGEVLGDAGWLCDPDDAPAFSRAASEILALGPRRALP
jgi:glycosyltransferase involved in cell wall biosynthesis